jgi:hypothetical protein
VNKNWPSDLKFGCNASKNMANVFELEAKWAKELDKI